MPYVRSNGAEIYFEVRGTGGPPLVLIRGFASTIHTWNGVDHNLAKDHLTLVLDNRGVGRSSTPSGTYSAARMADDVAAVMIAAGIESAHVLGTSLGGMIAQELALHHPARVRSLSLAATAAGRGRGATLKPRGLLAIALALPSRLRARVSAPATLSPNVRRRTRPKLVAHRHSALERSPTPFKGLIGQAFAVFGHQTGTRLAQIRVPTLIIHGAADKLIDCRHARILGDLIPHTRMEFLPGAGHDLATEVPDRLASAVRQHVHYAIDQSHSYRAATLALYEDSGEPLARIIQLPTLARRASEEDSTSSLAGASG